MVQKANVDLEKLQVLTNYNKCYLDKFKECEATAAKVKKKLEDQLVDDLSIHYVDKISNTEEGDCTQNELVYDLCGYLLHTRNSVLQCDDCKKLLITEELELPEDFAPAKYTALRTRGGLKFATVEMYNTFRIVEAEIVKHFKKDHIYVRDTFQECISKLSDLKLLRISCDKHPRVLPFLIMEYVQLRFYFEGKRLRNVELSKSRSQVHSSFKIAKTS